MRVVGSGNQKPRGMTPTIGSRLSVDAEPLADDQPVGAELLPEPVAEHRDRLGTALVLALLEAAA